MNSTIKVMSPSPNHVQRVYLTLTLLSTLAASLIWGINTLFLLDAGLSNTQAFLANSFFTIGQVVFEVPTGIIADVRGRRTSYLLGTITLSLSTLLYVLAWYIQAPFLLWIVSSVLLGLGFTFFSGATEAWLVDALAAAKYQGKLETVFGRNQMVTGIAMLVGSVAGGLIAQFSSLGVPYVIRGVLLAVTFFVAYRYMKEWGFQPDRTARLTTEFRQLFVKSWNFSMQHPPVRWVMLAAPFTAGVSFYAFYALQPHLLQLYGNPEAYAVAGLAAAIIAGSQIIGGSLVPLLMKRIKRRTDLLLAGATVSILILALFSMVNTFWIAVALICVWGLLGAAVQPVRQAFLHAHIPSAQRATVLSFDSLVSSSGGAVIQPILGQIADRVGYSRSFLGGAVIQIVSLPFMGLARSTEVREKKDA